MFGDLLREAWLAARLQPPTSYVLGLFVNSLWLTVVLLAIAWYGGDLREVARVVFWGSVVFTIFSEGTWSAAAFSNYVRSGVMDYVVASPARLHLYLTAASLASSLLALPALGIQVAVYYLLFGEPPPMAQPAYFAASLLIFLASSSFITAAATMFFARFRNPSLAANVVQWAVPLSGGMIPPTAMPPEAARWFAYSPLHYVVAPVTYSATGRWLLDPVFTMAAGLLVAAGLGLLSLYAAESAYRMFRRLGKWGAE